jgi:hypothetical protein
VKVLQIRASEMLIAGSITRDAKMSEELQVTLNVDGNLVGLDFDAEGTNYLNMIEFAKFSQAGQISIQPHVENN